MRRKVAAWLNDNPAIVAVIAVCVTVAIVAAMFFGLDLSWIPDVVRSFFV